MAGGVQCVPVEARVGGKLPRTKAELRAAVFTAPETVEFRPLGSGARESFTGVALPPGARLWVDRSRWWALVAWTATGPRLD